MSHSERRSALNPSGPLMLCRVLEICFPEMTAVEWGWGGGGGRYSLEVTRC